jgi:RNase P subunit RPR2
MGNKQHFFNKKKKKEIDYLQQISSDRVEFLMKQALIVFPRNKDLANRYVSLSRKIAQSAKISIPQKYKIYICRGCKKLIIPGSNCYIRIRSLKGQGTHLTATCLECGKRMRRYFKKNRPIRVKKSKKEKREIKEKNEDKLEKSEMV